MEKRVFPLRIATQYEVTLRKGTAINTHLT